MLGLVSLTVGLMRQVQHVDVWIFKSRTWRRKKFFRKRRVFSFSVFRVLMEKVLGEVYEGNDIFYVWKWKYSPVLPWCKIFWYVQQNCFILSAFTAL
jgi:hypothetical protein